MMARYYYNQIIEKDNLGYESISSVCQFCWSRAEYYAEGKEKYSGKCDKENCTYRDIDININENLKSCPICGSDNIKVGLNAADSYDSLWYVRCQRCGLKNSGFNIDKYSKKDIYDYWNNRKGE